MMVKLAVIPGGIFFYGTLLVLSGSHQRSIANTFFKIYIIIKAHIRIRYVPI